MATHQLRVRFSAWTSLQNEGGQGKSVLKTSTGQVQPGDPTTKTPKKATLAQTINQPLGHLQVGWFACSVKHVQCILFSKRHRKLPLQPQKCSPHQEGAELRQLGHVPRRSPHATARSSLGDVPWLRTRPVVWAAEPASRLLVSSLAASDRHRWRLHPVFC